MNDQLFKLGIDFLIKRKSKTLSGVGISVDLDQFKEMIADTNLEIKKCQDYITNHIMVKYKPQYVSQIVNITLGRDGNPQGTCFAHAEAKVIFEIFSEKEIGGFELDVLKITLPKEIELKINHSITNELKMADLEIQR